MSKNPMEHRQTQKEKPKKQRKTQKDNPKEKPKGQRKTQNKEIEGAKEDMKGPEGNAEGVTEVEIKNQEPRIKNHEQHQHREQHKQ